MLHECSAAPILWVIWDVEFDSGILVYFARGKAKVKSNQVKLQNVKFSSKNMHILSSIVSEFQKNVTNFHYVN